MEGDGRTLDVPWWCEHYFVLCYGFSITFTSQTHGVGCLQHQSYSTRASVPQQPLGGCSRRISRNAGKVLEKVNWECAKAALLPKGRETEWKGHYQRRIERSCLAVEMGQGFPWC